MCYNKKTSGLLELFKIYFREINIIKIDSLMTTTLEKLLFLNVIATFQKSIL